MELRPYNFAIVALANKMTPTIWALLVKVDRIAVLVDCPVLISPLPADLDIGLVDPDRTTVQ